MALAVLGTAQSYVHQVFVLNEGYYDYFGGQGQLVPVSLGSYDPALGTYTTVAVFEGPRFGSDVLVHDGTVYVAADDRILMLDADDFSTLATTSVTGVRKLAIWNDQLLLTRGELGGLSHYFEARDRASLELLYTIGPDEGLPYSAEDVLVVDDVAFLAVNNAFDWNDLQGRIGMVDLEQGGYLGDVDLGPDGLNPEHLMHHEGAVFAFNNKDFGGSSISRVHLDGTMLDYTVNVATTSGCAASVLADGRIYFLEYAQAELARFDIATGQVLDTLPGTPEVYGLVDDPINGVLYATTTDYFSQGDLHVMSREGEVLSTVAVGVAPGNLALDVRSSTGIAMHEAPGFSLYPNPAAERVVLSGVLPQGPVNIRITDATGRLVLEETRSLEVDGSIAVDTLRPGVYAMSLNGGRAVRFIRK